MRCRSLVRSAFPCGQPHLKRHLSTPILPVACDKPIVRAQVNILVGMAEMVVRSLEKDWVTEQRRASAKLTMPEDLKVRACLPVKPSC